MCTSRLDACSWRFQEATADERGEIGREELAIDWGTDNVTAGQASERVATIELQISGMLRGRRRFCLRLERGKKRHKGEECMLRRACHDREEYVVPLYVADLAEWIPIRAEKVGELTPMHRVRVGEVERLPQRLRLTRQMHHGPADVVHRRDINGSLVFSGV